MARAFSHFSFSLGAVSRLGPILRSARSCATFAANAQRGALATGLLASVLVGGALRAAAPVSNQPASPSPPAPPPAASASVGSGNPAAGQLASAANPFETMVAPTFRTPIDDLFFTRLKELGLQPAYFCTDAVFIRRVYLDVIGTLPTPAEVRPFLLDRSPTKRRALIDRLLARDEFVDYWTMKWSDLLRVKAEFPINLWPNAAQAYSHWIRESIRANEPYDRFARELLTSDGSNFRVGPVNFYRAVQSKEPTALARTVALTLMGTRAEKWPAERLAGLAVFFSQLGYKATGEWKEEIVFFDPTKLAAATAPVTATFPDGTQVVLSPDRDPREVFADWLIDPKNPWFTRAIANRVWSWLLGAGLVQEPDDLRPDNPPSHPAILAYLEQQLINNHYDVKALFRLILNSQVYQLSSVPRSLQPEAAAHFAFYPLRRLDAEVLIDALNQITGTTETYSSAIPEPFTFIPVEQRSIALPDGSISSAFLEMFGRPPRDTGLETERNNRSSATQSLHLLNSSHIQRKLEQGPAIQNILRTRTSPRDVVDGIYLLVLSRFPTDAERQTVAAYTAASDAPLPMRQTALDLAWALINSPEFLYRH